MRTRDARERERTKRTHRGRGLGDWAGSDARSAWESRTWRACVLRARAGKGGLAAGDAGTRTRRVSRRAQGEAGYIESMHCVPLSVRTIKCGSPINGRPPVCACSNPAAAHPAPATFREIHRENARTRSVRLRAAQISSSSPCSQRGKRPWPLAMPRLHALPGSALDVIAVHRPHILGLATHQIRKSQRSPSESGRSCGRVLPPKSGSLPHPRPIRRGR